MPGKDREGKAREPKRPILQHSGVLEPFWRPPVSRNPPPTVQQAPPPQQPPPSPKIHWPDPDDFLSSPDLYPAPVPSSSQQHEPSSSDRPASSRPTESAQGHQKTLNEPDDREDIHKFLLKLGQNRYSPSAPCIKLKSSHQQTKSGPESPPAQNAVAAKEASEADRSSQQQPYILRIPCRRRLNDKDPSGLHFGEEELVHMSDCKDWEKETEKNELSGMDTASEDAWEELVILKKLGRP